MKIGKFKAVPIKSYDDACVYYIIKASNELKNEVAHEEKMMIYNFREGIICPFNKNKADMYESFNTYHD